MPKVKITEKDLMRVLDVAHRVAARTGRIAVPRWDDIEIVQSVDDADLHIKNEGAQPPVAMRVV